MLSAFGEMFERLVLERKRSDPRFSKRQLADLAGVAPSRLTESLRDGEWARKNKIRWYGPDLDKAEMWAKAFGLEGDEREIFLDLAALAHSPPRALRRYLELKAKVRSLAALVKSYEADQRAKR